MAPRATPWKKDRLHLWNEEQERLARLRVVHDQLECTVDQGAVHGLTRMAGVDISFFPDTGHAVAAVVVLSFPELHVVYEQCATVRITVPYIPGYLAFREIPFLESMLRDIDSRVAPQVVLVDGNGAFHPRQCGAATHLGVALDIPTIGVAKTVMRVGSIGRKEASKLSKMLTSPGKWAMFAEPGQEPLAVLLRPGNGSKTLVVSPGHRVALQTAAAIVSAVSHGGMPEPLRLADSKSRAAVRQWLAGVSLPELKIVAPGLPGKRHRASHKSQQVHAAGKKAKLVWRQKATVPTFGLQPFGSNEVGASASMSTECICIAAGILDEEEEQEEEAERRPVACRTCFLGLLRAVLGVAWTVCPAGGAGGDA
mmetsp:Transcript_40412/g.91225  ORF Transcript_40412/g.91225 Transcript_40412/m.91225 type:complete len:368 (-) Transcript_40412:7-1110(-)